MALNFPANPAAQNPINTYSPDSTPDFTTNGATYIWTGNAWTGSVDGVGLTITSSATPPTDASPNDLWFNTDNGKLYIYYKDVDSEQWVDTSADSTSSLVIVSETPPPNPVQGELWWDSSTTGGILYIYYTDPDSNQWVEVGGNGDGGSGGGATVSSGPNPPDNPAINTLWFNTETGKLYIYYQDADSAQWVDTDVGGSTEAMPTGGGSDKVFYENDQNIKTDFTLDENTNAMTAGPITVDDGVSVTIPAGQTWTVVGGSTGGGSGGGGGDSGFWQRQGTSLSPANAGDDVGTTGDISANRGSFTGRVVAGNYDVGFSDKTGVRVGDDGRISVQNPVGSSGTYAYDVLSGNTPVYGVLGTGETRIGGDITAAGTGRFGKGKSGETISANDAFTIETDNASGKTRAINIYGNSDIPSTYQAFAIRHDSNEVIQATYDGSLTAAGDVKIGGTSAAPNIELKADGNAYVGGGFTVNGASTFKNQVKLEQNLVVDTNITADGNITTPSSYEGGSETYGSKLLKEGVIQACSASDVWQGFEQGNAAATSKISATGNAIFAGSITSASATFTGKITASGEIKTTAAVNANYLELVNSGSTDTNCVANIANQNGNSIVLRGDGIFVGPDLQSVNAGGGPTNTNLAFKTDGSIDTVGLVKITTGDRSGYSIQTNSPAGLNGYNVGQTKTQGSFYLVQESDGLGVYLPVGNTSWAPVSSSEDAKDVLPMSVDNSWDVVRDIELFNYYYKVNDEKHRANHPPYFGPMAHRLGQQDPDLLIDNGDGCTYNAGLLEMKALSALSAALTRIEELEAKVAALES